MTALCWHLVAKGGDYAFARPGLVAFKRRELLLQAGAERCVARRGLGGECNDKTLRRHEWEIVEQQERACAVMTAHWQSHGPAAASQNTT